MNQDAWPSREGAPERAPLPRAEDLPVAENGYERDAVHAAFDAFYRHTAQLDATLRTLEAVDTFTRQAAELRADLRTLRSSGVGPQSWSSPYSAPVSERAGISPAVPRIAIELAFVIAVPVLAGAVGNFDSSIVLAVTLAAWALTALIEFTAYRARISSPVLPRGVPGEPAPVVVDPKAAVEPVAGDELVDAQEGALTMIAPATEVGEIEAAAVDPEPVAEPQPEPEPVAEVEPVAVIEPPTPEPTFPAPPTAPTVEPPTPEPSIAPPEPEPTFPPREPEPTFPPEQPEQPEPAPAEPDPRQPVAESDESRRRRSLFRRAREEAAIEPQPQPEPEPEPEPEPVAEPKLQPNVEKKPKRRLFGRRHLDEAEAPALELAAEPEPEPAERYVDPWERDFEYAALEEPENVVESEAASPEEPTQEPLTAERAPLEPEESVSNGAPREGADEIPVATAPRRPMYVPRRGRRR